MSVITLTSDFGTCDWFVGTMKGVILGINARARITDLTHEITPGDVTAAAFALASACRFFPQGTIHLAVVDPGVGGPRRAIAIKTSRFVYIGPDNGVLSLAVAPEDVRTVRLLENPRLFRSEVSRTFHGRDIFAPVAAHLSKGLGFRKLGPRAASYVQLGWPKAYVNGNELVGEVVHIDHFGNAITNIPEHLLLRTTGLGVFVKKKHLCDFQECYSAVPAGAPVAVVGSSGCLEIAVNQGSAAQVLKLKRGDEITACPYNGVREQHHECLG